MYYLKLRSQIVCNLKRIKLQRSALFGREANNIEGGCIHTHFKATGRPHPLGVKTNIGLPQLGDHTGFQQNHIWTPEELKIKMQEQPRHQPQTISDHIMNKMVPFLIFVKHFRSFI